MPSKSSKNHRSQYIAIVAASIDGRISLTHQKHPDWTSAEDYRTFKKLLSTMDAFVVGLNTYRAGSALLKGKPTVVFTHRAVQSKKDATVIFINPQTVNIAKILRPYKRVGIVGAGQVYQTMLDKGLLDELYVTLEPLVFGRGKPMFDGGTKTKRFQLISVRRLNRSGTLLLHYRIALQ